MSSEERILIGFELSKEFKTRKGIIRALQRASMEIGKGEIVALLGESGSGKTTLAKILAYILKPSEGRVIFRGKNLAEMDKMELKFFRTKVQYVPQYSDLALDPLWHIYDSIAEPLRIHGMVESKQEELERVLEIADLLNLGIDHLRRKPRDLSGGELQRAVFARAIVLKPEVLIADEPTSMLDPVTQSKIIWAIMNAREKIGFSILMITHDFNLARLISERLYVMFCGKIVESGQTEEIFSNPLHPYTSLLIDKETGHSIEMDRKCLDGCEFRFRCRFAKEECKIPPPEFKVNKGRTVRCWLYGEPDRV